MTLEIITSCLSETLLDPICATLTSTRPLHYAPTLKLRVPTSLDQFDRLTQDELSIRPKLARLSGQFYWFEWSRLATG